MKKGGWGYGIPYRSTGICGLRHADVPLTGSGGIVGRFMLTRAVKRTASIVSKAESVGGELRRTRSRSEGVPHTASRSITCKCSCASAVPRTRIASEHSTVVLFLPHTPVSYSIWRSRNLSVFSYRPPLGMAVQSILRPSEERIAQLVTAYAKHRPLVQRGLTLGFVVYVISTTYRSLAARPASASSSPSKRKGKGKDGDGAGKPPRVAVSPYKPSSQVHRLSGSVISHR